ncbi:MAG: hypothetical protein OHK0022_46260 [Roseiflexaceae bacterium]
MSDSSTGAELNLLVGSMFTTRADEDRALYEQEREWLSELQDLLREEGIEADLLSRPGVEVWEGSIEDFSEVHRLQLLAAYLEHGQDIAGLLSTDMDPYADPDPLLEEIWNDERQTRYPHLIRHSPHSGYYLPVEFGEPLQLVADEEAELDEEDEAIEDISIGSSIALQRELVDLEQQFQAAGISTKSAPYRALRALRDAADQSVKVDLPIVLW